MEDFIPALIGLIAILMAQVFRLRKAFAHQNQQFQNQQTQHEQQLSKLSEQLKQLKDELQQSQQNVIALQQRCDTLAPAQKMLRDTEISRDKAFKANQLLAEEKNAALIEIQTHLTRIKLLEQRSTTQAEQIALLNAKPTPNVVGMPPVFSDYDARTQSCGLPTP